MASERLYTRQEIDEILKIHDRYRDSGIVDLRQAKSLVKRLQKYPIIFEKQIELLTKQIERYRELKNTKPKI